MDGCLIGGDDRDGSGRFGWRGWSLFGRIGFGRTIWRCRWLRLGVCLFVASVRGRSLRRLGCKIIVVRWGDLSFVMLGIIPPIIHECPCHIITCVKNGADLHRVSINNGALTLKRLIDFITPSPFLPVHYHSCCCVCDGLVSKPSL